MCKAGRARLTLGVLSVPKTRRVTGRALSHVLRVAAVTISHSGLRSLSDLSFFLSYTYLRLRLVHTIIQSLLTTCARQPPSFTRLVFACLQLNLQNVFA